jgi:hypothetical protein
MGRPRKYASNAEKQAAYRERILKATSKVKAKVTIDFVKDVRGKEECSAYTPHGTKCKFCGKNH